MRLHQRLGYTGIGLAVLIVVIGVRTALEAARHGTLSTPEDFHSRRSRLSRLAIWCCSCCSSVVWFIYRRSPARHKGLMLLTVANFLPPAVGRLPFASVKANPVVFGLGLPLGLAIVCVAYDAWKRRRVDWLLLGAAALLIASFPARIALIATPWWANASTWLTTLVD